MLFIIFYDLILILVANKLVIGLIYGVALLGAITQLGGLYYSTG